MLKIDIKYVNSLWFNHVYKYIWIYYDVQIIWLPNIFDNIDICCNNIFYKYALNII